MTGFHLLFVPFCGSTWRVHIGYHPAVRAAGVLSIKLGYVLKRSVRMDEKKRMVICRSKLYFCWENVLSFSLTFHSSLSLYPSDISRELKSLINIPQAQKTIRTKEDIKGFSWFKQFVLPQKHLWTHGCINCWMSTNIKFISSFCWKTVHSFHFEFSFSVLNESLRKEITLPPPTRSKWSLCM